MALNYMAIIGHYHPTVVCHCFGDPDVYANIVWVSGDAMPSQATLDAQKITLANQTVQDPINSFSESPRNKIAFTSEGSSFSPLITVTGSPVIKWEWSDGTTSNVAAPSKTFGSVAKRVQYLTVTPWSALTGINLGYDEGDGTGQPHPVSLHDSQGVSNVENLHLASQSLISWSSEGTGTNPNTITSLNFDNFVKLTHIECYVLTSLTSVSLHNCPRLIRACFEQCRLFALNLSECPRLEDLRSADNVNYHYIEWGRGGKHLWHHCTRSNPQLILTDKLEDFPAASEWWDWNSNQSGTMVSRSSVLHSVFSMENYYTSADFTNSFLGNTNNHQLNMSLNNLTSVTLTGCVGLTSILLQNNSLNEAAVDSILQTVDLLGRTNGTINLSTNAPPSITGSGYATSLQSKGWTVTVD